MQRRITSIGQGAPAMIPVRNDDRSKLANSGCSSCAMNIVGTPCSPVHFSSATVCKVASGSNPSPGYTIAVPCVVQARLPNTMPKQ
jgi:hypothetical protein